MSRTSRGTAQIGSDFVAKSAADGHTLLAITLTSSASFTLHLKGPFSFGRDFFPLVMLSNSPVQILVSANSPISGFKDLLRRSRTRVL